MKLLIKEPDCRDTVDFVGVLVVTVDEKDQRVEFLPQFHAPKLRPVCKQSFEALEIQGLDLFPCECVNYNLFHGFLVLGLLATRVPAVNAPRLEEPFIFEFHAGLGILT